MSAPTARFTVRAQRFYTIFKETWYELVALNTAKLGGRQILLRLFL